MIKKENVKIREINGNIIEGTLALSLQILKYGCDNVYVYNFLLGEVKVDDINFIKNSIYGFSLLKHDDKLDDKIKDVLFNLNEKTYVLLKDIIQELMLNIIRLIEIPNFDKLNYGSLDIYKRIIGMRLLRENNLKEMKLLEVS